MHVLERKVIVRLSEGLHARPATQFVKLARGFACDIEVLREGAAANAKSSVKLMLLGVKEDEEVTLRANGADEAEAIEALARYVSEGETEAEPAAPAVAAPPPVAATPAPVGALRGSAASAGCALGPASAFLPEAIVAPRRVVPVDEIEAEVARLAEAIRRVEAELTRRRARAAPDTQEFEILAALAEIGRDEELSRRIETAIRAGADAVSAALDGGGSLAREFEALTDPYMQARGEDVAAFARQIALALLGKQEPSLAEAPKGSVVLADEISAFDLAGASLNNFAGLISLKGGPTSHVAIIARSYGVPAVLGLDIKRDDLARARHVALDGSSGEVALDPDAATRARFEQRIAEAATRRQALMRYAHVEPRTRDGRLIEIGANLGSLKEIDAALAAGAMGVGLFRTELMFMERKRPPTEDEQTATYRKLAEAFAPRPVIVRTLDIGGDKPTPGIVIPKEDNPFLGWRGVRLCLDRPDIYKPQLRALLRAAVCGNLKVMVPMIADVEEVRAVKRLLAECRAELVAEGVAVGDLELGVMAETPAAALAAEDIAPEVAFFSIGTNDLTQYVMAADRMNPRVAHLNRADHPAVLKAVRMICEAARAAGIWVGVCGEAAGKPEMIAKFVALGVTELSMSAAAIPEAKKCVTEI